jgi:hypothetical protein
MGAVISRALERHRRKYCSVINGVGAGAGCASPVGVLLPPRRALKRTSHRSVPIDEV